MRHLTTRQAVAALCRGREIEQFLGREQLHDGRWAVRWISISPTRSCYRISVHHVEDVGQVPDVVDVSEFPPIDVEEPIGEGQAIDETEDPVDAIDAAASLGASLDQWVNQGIIGDEYADAVAGSPGQPN